MSVKMTKQQEAEARKRAILSGAEFRQWWSARQNIKPVPSDPYRAFMIDLALRARVLPQQYWQPRVNWSDYPPVDYPVDLPFPKGKPISRKEMRRLERIPKAAKPVPRTPYEKELERYAEELAEKYHVPKPRLFFEPYLTHERAYYYAGYPAVGTFPYIRLGTKFQKGKPERAIIKGVLSHEFGHHVHYAYGGTLAESIGIRVPAFKAERIERERTAWRIAKPHMAPMRPLQTWMKKYALGTYLGTTKGVKRI